MARVSFLFLCWCLDIVKVDKTPLIYCFHISIWEVGALFWGLSPPNPPCGDGNGGCMVPRWKSPDVMVRVSFVSLLMPWHCKNRQNPTFIFQFGGAWCIVLGDGAHEITPLATGLAVCETWKSIALPRSSWLPNNCRKAFACFGQVYLMCLIIVNICPFWARLINVAENCNENRKISCLNLIYFYCR